jgi:hypothetical protein
MTKQELIFVLIQGLYAPVLIGIAKLNAISIKNGKYKNIKHGWQGALHIALAIACALTFVWYTAFIILCEARVVFNTALNGFRGLPIDYVTSEKRPASILDRIEKRVFGMNGWLPLLIYFISWVGINLIYYL